MTKRGNNYPNYEKCFVAFIDILGFAALVQQSEENSKTLSLLRNCLRACGAFPQSGLKGVTDGSRVRNIEFRTQQFSDSIVIYCKEDPADLSQMFFMIRYLQDRLWEKEICLRGAITIGDMYWPTAGENIVLGPAMIEAYKLESGSATYPRILISQSLCDYIDQEKPSAGDYLTDASELANAIRTDFDLPFLDLLNPQVTRKRGERLSQEGGSFSIMWDPYKDSRYSEVCESVNRMIATQLNQNTATNTRKKYQWLQSYVNRASKNG